MALFLNSCPRDIGNLPDKKHTHDSEFFYLSESDFLRIHVYEIERDQAAPIRSPDSERAIFPLFTLRGQARSEKDILQ